MKKSIDQSGLLRHSVFLFLTTQVANVSNLLYQAVTGRSLTTEEYGVLAAMMNLLLITATPMEALRTAMAHFVARTMKAGNPGEIRWLVGIWSRRLLLVAAVVVAAGFLFSGPVADFFQLTNTAPFEITCVLVACTLFLPLMTGTFQGAEKFIWVSLSLHVWTILRLGIVYLFMLLHPSAIMGLAAHGLALAMGLLISVEGLRRLTRGYESAPPAQGMGSYFMQTLYLLGAFAILMNADILLVKHFFHPEDAGLFARAATIGRSVIFLPMPIALVMFPKVISRGAVDGSGRGTLLKALLLVVFLVGGAVGAVYLFPWLPLWLLYGDRHPTADMIRLLITLVTAMAPMGFTYLLINYEMAQRRFRATRLLAGCAVAYMLGVFFWHETLMQIVYVMGTVTMTAFLGLLVMILLENRRPMAPEVDHAEVSVESPG
ncbi:MAG: hypothetical protein KDL31_05145 [Kiritimatiellae bacterium]|nr:hypothetical protein [Kiritimatiellia bacterium]